MENGLRYSEMVAYDAPKYAANKLCYLLQISARLGFLLVDTIKCSYTIRVSLSLLYTQ